MVKFIAVPGEHKRLSSECNADWYPVNDQHCALPVNPGVTSALHTAKESPYHPQVRSHVLSLMLIPTDQMRYHSLHRLYSGAV